MVKVVVNGHRGKMSSLFCSALPIASGLSVLGILQARSPVCAVSGPHDLAAIQDAEIGNHNATVIDFTHRDCTIALLSKLEDTQCKLIIGTSGLSNADITAIEAVSDAIPIFRAANFSRGVHTVLRALARMRDDLDANWSAQVLDLHFATKLDTPSATAKEFAKAATLRDGETVDIATLRLGDGVSEHKAYIAGTGERIELAHKLLDRRAFLSTVVDAIAFLEDKQSGLFGMNDLYPE